MLSVNLPDVPVTVRVTARELAVSAAFNVSVLLVVAGLD